jgi:hypothetical protein
MPLASMYERVVPSTMPKVGDQKRVPTGPAQTEVGVVTAVDPEGIIILKLPNSVFLVGYAARKKRDIDVRRLRDNGTQAPADEELWIFNWVERP